MKHFFVCCLLVTVSALFLLPTSASASPSQADNRIQSTAVQNGVTDPSIAVPVSQGGNRYQGQPVTVRNPGKQTTPESNMTRSQMEQLMGSNISPDAKNATQQDIVRQLEVYWLPNSMRQLTNTFQSFSGIRRNVPIRFDSGIPDTFGVNSWARCTYYGYGTSGMDNRMVSISITLDTQDCLDASANTLISGTGTAYKYDQILAHELMHAFMAEIAPGFLLGPTNSEWFSEGASEMVNGGVAHMNNRTSSQMCSRIGLSGGADYGGSYLAVCYASWLSANNGYGGTCTVTADNLAYGLDRILAKLRETGDLDLALKSTIGMDTSAFESLVRSGDSGKLSSFHNMLVTSCTNSEGVVGSGSVVGGNLKLQSEYVIANHQSSLGSGDPFQFSIG